MSKPRLVLLLCRRKHSIILATRAKYEGYVLNATNVAVSALSVFLDATATFGMFNVGGTFAYLSGDDPSTKDKIEGGINTAGLDWQPCLILFNTDLNYWLPTYLWSQ